MGKHSWQFFILPLLTLICISCPAATTKPETPESPVTETKPIIQTPGTYLIYTVNDYEVDVLRDIHKAHIIIADPAGSRREVLFSYTGFIFDLVPSPNADTIAFVAAVDAPGNSDERHLFLYNIDNGQIADISAQGQISRFVDSPPVFAPDGKSVLFLSKISRDSLEYNIFTCDVETRRAKGLYTKPVDGVPITLTPDGHIVAVRKQAGSINAFEYLSIDPATASDDVLYGFRNVTKVGPAYFSFDGNIMFCDTKPYEPESGVHGGERSRKVYAVDLLTQTETELFEPNSVAYVYGVFNNSEHSDRVIVRRQEVNPDKLTPVARIALCPVDGSNIEYLTPLSIRSELTDPPTNVHVISPDNKYIFYYQIDPEFEFKDIYVVPLDGTEPINISKTARYPEGAAGWITVSDNGETQ